MPRPSLELGLLALFALGIASVERLMADPPKPCANPFGEANPKPSAEKPAEKKRAIKLSETKAPTEAEIRKALETPSVVNFIDTPLVDCINYLAKQAKTNLWIDEQALTEEGVKLSEPINLKGKPLAVARILDRVLEPLGLTWVIEDHVVKITTIIDAEEKVITVTYHVGDLLEYGKDHRREEVSAFDGDSLEYVQFGGCGGASACGDPENDDGPGYWLIHLLEFMTSPSWSSRHEGPGGTISLLENNLVIRQTHYGHEEVERILHTIRQFTQGPLNPATVPIRPLHYPIEEDEFVKNALTKVVNVECRELPLNQFLKEVSAKLDIPVEIDELALQEEGVALEEPITLHLENLPAKSILQITFEPLGLAGLVEDGRLLVTSIIAAEERHFTKIHDIRDLYEAKHTGTALLDLLQQETSGPWGEIDGTGGWIDEPLNGLLVVRQTEGVHNEVEAVLADVRKQIAEDPKTVEEKKEPPDPQAVSTKFYSLNQATDPEAVRQAILTLVEPKTWAKNGGEGEMVLIGYQLVVKHKNEVQAKVDEFLKDLNKSVGSSMESGMGTGFTGGSGLWHQHTSPAQPNSSGGGFFQVPSSP